MTEISVLQVWLMLSFMMAIFLSGLCWCFCCGTCVGRSILQNTGLLRFTRDGNDNRQWKQVPQQDEEESWHLQNWEEENEEDENENIHQ